jgi:hypothetical protein
MTRRAAAVAVALTAALTLACQKDRGPTESSLFIDIVIEPPTPVVALGGQVTLTARVTGPPGISQFVVWTALDPDIATVTTGGVVTAHAEGGARIRAEWAIDPMVFREVEVQVTATPIEDEDVTPPARSGQARDGRPATAKLLAAAAIR